VTNSNRWLSVKFKPLVTGSKVYVTNLADCPSTVGSVLVIATATNTVTANVPNLHCPQGVAVSPDGRKVYVASQVFNPPMGLVAVIDEATNTVTATIPIPSYNCVGSLHAIIGRCRSARGAA
jgi:YVTN family beta-propeller protein